MRVLRRGRRARGRDGSPGVQVHDHDRALGSMAPVLRGDIPVMVATSEVAGIRAALAWAAEEHARRRRARR
jgi:hypothetical protein